MQDSSAFEPSNGSQIAIIAMAGRFPGAGNISAFWDNLRNGVESIDFFTDEQLQASGVDPEALKNTNYVRARPVLEGVELFEAAFFGFTPREAAAMDPQQRLFMECVWEAIETAGYDTETYKGMISVYAGIGASSYLFHNLYANPKAMALAGEWESFLANLPDALATRIAYKLNLRGACCTVQSFCSSSLVAVQMACQSLLNFECDMAVAGGVTVMVPQHTGYLYQEGTIVSPDGHCRPFDAKAQGTVFGNGLGAVVLKRLEDALADGDHIDAMIIGSAKNNDGSLKVSYTAPSVSGQAEVIVEALADADVDPETITYIETHGTGTALGDPTEVTALTKAFRSGTEKNGFCAIGSLKSNIGHLDAAAGVAALIKTVLALKNKEVPPSLHFEKPNPNIDFENSPFFVNASLSPWKTDGTPRRAGVSSFGIGGTNSHVIVQEAPVLEPTSASRPHQLLILSAKTDTALKTATENMAAHLRQHPHLNLADVAYTLKVGRRAFNHRRAIVCEDITDAVTALEAVDRKKVMTAYQEQRDPPVVFMFSGQGSQYVHMGLELYQTELAFQEQMDRCAEILKPQLCLDLRDILYPNEDNTQKATQELAQTCLTQPALFALEYALARLWMSWGIQPRAMIGHSIGEYVAACLAGVFSLEDALSLVATRGRLMQDLPPGSMLSVGLSEKALEPYLGEDISLAAVNGPRLCVVSGSREAIADLEDKLVKRDISCTRLHTSHAFHSKMMDPILHAFTERVEQVHLSPNRIPFISNVTGTWIDAAEVTSPGYWARHLRRTVRFSAGVAELLKEPRQVFLEIGPGQVLSVLARQHLERARERTVLCSTRHPKEQKSDVAFLLNTLGRLWLAGVHVDWSGFYGQEHRHRLPLPTYPFERQRFWIEPVNPPTGVLALQAGLTRPAAMRQEHSNEALPSEALVARDSAMACDYVAPRDETEQAIAEIWQRLFGIAQVGVYDDYFELGGTSLMAVRMVGDMEKIFGKKIPLATLLEAPTIEELARIINNEDWSADWSSLVPIKSDGTKPPFYCVHGAGGHVLEFYPLARHLAEDQPFYGIQAQGLNGKSLGSLTIEDMATRYVEEIRAFQPEGPYIVGGYCFGGTVAYEMAQQLLSQGQAVAALLIIEGHCAFQDDSDSLNDYSWLHRLVTCLANKISLEQSNLSVLNAKQRAKYLWTRCKRVAEKLRVKTEMALEPVLSRLDSRKAHALPYMVEYLREKNIKALESYIPRPYQGKVIIFRCSEKSLGVPNDAFLGWGRFIDGNAESHTIPGRHENIVDEPWVQGLAEKLNRSLDFSPEIVLRADPLPEAYTTPHGLQTGPPAHMNAQGH